MKFALFLVLNAILLIRPEELFPAVTGVRLYLIAIALCTLVCLPDLLTVLSWDSLRLRPISVCVLIYFASTIISLCVVGSMSEAFFEFAPEFAKVILYYFLLIAIIDAPGRLRAFAVALIVLIAVLACIALAQLHGYASFPNIDPVAQREVDPITGEETWIPRLVSSGIFNDPNDLCLILGLGILCCVYLVTTGDQPFAIRAIWLLPIPLYCYAVTETHSRGGLMGALAGLGAYVLARFGGPKGLPFAIGGAVAALALIGGRQGNIGGGGTAHERVMFWADGLSNLFNTPRLILTGLGDGWFVRENGLVAHNSFVQAYVEQGVLGGGAFLGAFVFGAWISVRLGRKIAAPAWILEARPFGFAVVCGYGMGCYSLTRNTVLTTYMVLGIVAVLVESSAVTMPTSCTVDRRWLFRCALLSTAGLIVMKYATQFLGLVGV